MDNNLIKNIFLSCALWAFLLILVYILWQGLYHFFVSKDIAFLYQEEKYEEILQKYTNHKNPKVLHNLGNTSYQIFIQTGEISFWEQARDFFQASLQKQEHPDTRYNLELVEKLLSQDESSSHQNSQQDFEDDTADGNSSEENEWTSKKEGNIWKENDEEKSSLGEENWLTQEQSQALENVIESLKDEQRQNQQFFGKQDELQESENLFWDPLRGFDSFFSENFLPPEMRRFFSSGNRDEGESW